VECAHEYEIRYSKQHPGKVGECPTCDRKFVGGEEVKVGQARRDASPGIVSAAAFAGFQPRRVIPVQKLTIYVNEEAKLIDNKKVVSAVSTIQALTPEEYALVLALTKREVEKVVVKRGPRKKKGLPEAVAESKSAE